MQTEAQAANALRKIAGDMRNVLGDLYRVEYGSIISAGKPSALGSGDISTHEMEMMPRLQERLDKFEAAVGVGGKHIMSTAFAGTVRDTLSRSTGYMVQDLMTHGAVRVLARAEVGKFEEPAKDLLHGVHEYFSSLCSILVRQHFADHPALRDHVETALDGLLKESLSLCAARLSEQMTIEMDEVYTLNHYYSDTVAKVLARLEEVVVGDAADLDMEVRSLAYRIQTMRFLLILYFPPQRIIEGVHGSSFLCKAVEAGSSETWDPEAKERATGTFVPTTEIHDGKVRYRKRNDKDTWLEYGENQKTWYIITLAARDAKIFFSLNSAAELAAGTWKDNDGRYLKVTEVEPKHVDGHDNLERAVKETQVRACPAPYVALL